MTGGDRIAAVSGGSRGIGLEIVRQLAAQGHRVIMGARDVAAGDAARAGLGDAAGRVEVRQLDVADPASIAAFADSVAADPGALDVLVNNAGVALDAGVPGANPDFEAMQRTLDVNLLGAWRLTAALAPLLQESGRGRIVSLSSGMGQLAEMGSGSPAYRVSKAGINVMTRVLANELRGDGVLVNAACPGWVRTDMGGSGAYRDVPEGADTPVWLATLPGDGPTGGFFRNREPIPW
jgi:NAD(P)-dependent dehydrogenase (short-subunit alcohol dehydrogenase family)